MRDVVFYAASLGACIAIFYVTILVAVDGGVRLVEPNPYIIWGEVAAMAALVGYGSAHLIGKVRQMGLRLRWEAEKRRFYK